MSKGWIKLHRQIMDHPFYTEDRVFSRHEAWEFLLLNANHADAKIMIDGQLITVERGSLITSIRKLQDRWKWSNTKVSRFLDVLQSEGMATVKSDTKKTVITLDRYGFYQGLDDEETTPKRRQNDAEATQKHTNKNVKNEKNEKIEESIYTIFDHWNSKKIVVHRELAQTTKSAINARLESYSVEAIVEAIDNYHLCLTDDMYFYSYKFTLKEFMNTKNLDKFLTENDPFSSFRKKQNGRGWSESGQGSARHGRNTPKSPEDSVTGGQLGWLNRDKRKVVPMREVQGSDWIPH